MPRWSPDSLRVTLNEAWLFCSIMYIDEGSLAHVPYILIAYEQ